MTETEAAKLLDVAATTLEPWDMQDPFNPENTVRGYLCKQSDHRYGALLIWQVNGIDTVPQVIYCTPKLHYPFNRVDADSDEERKYSFPKTITRVAVYDKLDGTNICAFSYADAFGARYLTYKTRLVPFLGDSKFGPFGAMWRELLDSSPDLRALVQRAMSGAETLSFELYGYRNRVLIVYDVPLATRLLFRVRQSDGEPVPPGEEDGPCALAPVHVFTSGAGLVEFYNAAREQAEAQNEKITMPDSEDGIRGTEGFVFYVRDGDGLWHLFKCKPAGIEALHWASDSIPESVIRPTVINALESCSGELTVEYVKQLLLEEFSQVQVDSSHVRIEKIIKRVVEGLAWKKRVSDAYAATGLTFRVHGKGDVMRAMSRMFERAEMKGVYSALRESGFTEDA